MRIILATIAALGIFAAPYSVEACEKCKDSDKKTSDAVGTVAPAKAPQAVGNPVCPITGAKVGSMEAGAKLVYEDLEIGLCCNACKEAFMKEPKANLKKAQESAKK